MGGAIGPATVRAAVPPPIVGARQMITPLFTDHAAPPNRNLVKDVNGVVMTTYGGSIGNQYNPVTISQAAVAYYHAAFQSNESVALKNADRTALNIQANWLVAHQDATGRWLYKFPFGGQPVPWVSAMAEGVAISALIRANASRPDPRYLRAVAKARSTFVHDWSLGGVGSWQRVGTKRYLVYEEYMTPYSPHTLNGWMFAMAGLYEAWKYLGDSQAKAAFDSTDRGVRALKVLLPYYDTGRWSTYNLTRMDAKVNGARASRAYHEIHILQLHWFAKVTGDAFFEAYAKRFQGYLDACLAAGTCPP
jgi:heparosan-N-sulfate-glucuronate 5-epimerase